MNEIEEIIIQEVKDSALAIVSEDVTQMIIDQRLSFEQELEEITQDYIKSKEADRLHCFLKVKALLKKYGVE